MKTIIRVFPRATKATPRDALSFFDEPNGRRSALPDMFASSAGADEVHVSVTFTQDREKAERLAAQWQSIAPVKIGGVGWNDDPQSDFVPGLYIKPGYTFTSRGCPRKCWFCKVPKRNPHIKLLAIQDGWNILDDNLLACPRPHVEAVFAMLQRQGRQVEFTGGLEALALEDYQVGLLADLKPRPNCFWAYDPGDAFETLASAARRLLAAGFTARSHRLGCYVLIGYPGDTMEKAEKRLKDILSIGFTPRAMLWEPDTVASQTKHAPGDEWREFRRRWFRPAIIHAASGGAA